jgi:hypothetical protein
MLFWSCSSFVGWGQITVSSNTTWNSGNPPPAGYENGITINPYITLNIEGGLTLQMNANTTILVNSWATLNLSDITITTQLPNVAWNGIVAQSLTSTEQFSTIPDLTKKNDPIAWEGVLSGDKSLVRIINSVIQNAVKGVVSQNGSVIRTRNSQFYNCEMGVDILPYESNLYPNYNACYFQGTDFFWEDLFSDVKNLPFYSNKNFIGINLNGVRGVNIGGCLFKNYLEIPDCIGNRGRGIVALNSSFTVEEDGDQFCATEECPDVVKNCFSNPSIQGDGCRFIHLDKGIDYKVTSSHKHFHLLARHNLFAECLKGIYNDAGSSFIAHDNLFVLSRSLILDRYKDDGCEDLTTGYFLNHIHTNNTKQIKITKNNLYHEGTNINAVVVFNSASAGAKSIIKDNSFVGSSSFNEFSDEVRGIVSLSDNTTLEITCNTFDEHGVAIYNWGSASLNAQPFDPDLGTNNRYSNSSMSTHYYLYNLGTWGTHPNGSNYNDFQGSPNNWSSARYFSLSVDESSEEIVDCDLSCEDYFVDVAKVVDQASLLLYPNPASNILNIELNSTEFLGMGDISIISLDGREVLKENKELTQVFKLDISHLPNGMYILSVQHQNGIIQKRFIVTK